MSIGEGCLSSLLILCSLLFLYYIFKGKVEDEDEEKNYYSVTYLCQEIKRSMNEIVNMDLDVLRLNKRDLESRRELKRSLSDATRKCCQGDRYEKSIVIARIKSILSRMLEENKEAVGEAIPFEYPDQMSPLDKFEILIYLQKRSGNDHMFREICRGVGLDELKEDGKGYYYSITSEDIDEAYHRLCLPLSYDDKLNIITQRIYEETYGLSIVDLLIMEDASLDSVSGGVTGTTTENCNYREEDVYNGVFQKPKTYESVWVVYGGKPIYLNFLSFHSKADMIRICKNLSEHDRIGHFTSSEGGIKTHLADGSRVTIFRPCNASQWAFFVRKFGSTASFMLKDLITDQGYQYPLEVIKWAIKGCVNLIFSGDQNSGKTTNMRAAVREIDRRQQIRTLEADFELYLNDAYWDRNILGTRPSRELPFPKLIELLKASEAHTILFGETASMEHAKHLLDLLLAGTKRIITTGHWPTTEELISYFVLAEGGYGNDSSGNIERVVARLLNLDIHHIKENDGHRHIDRITEIIPYEREEINPPPGNGVEGKLDMIAAYLKTMTHRKSYYTRDIVIYENGEYHPVNPISEGLAEIILHNLSPEDKPLFRQFNRSLGGKRKAC